MKFHISPVLVCAMATFGSVATSQAAVIVVDASGGSGSQFTDLGLAAAAAQDGDTVLVRAGTYATAPILIDGKSLTITAELGADVQVNQVGLNTNVRGVIAVRNLGAEERVVLRGLDLSGGDFFALECADNQGTVLVEDCGLELEQAGFHGPLSLSVRNSAQVTLVRCSITEFTNQGALAFNGCSATPASFILDFCPSAVVVNSSVFLFDTQILAFDYSFATIATPALSAEDSLLFLSGCTVIGAAGRAGSGSGSNCDGEPGGDGVVLFGTSHADILGSALIGGPGGAASQTFCSPGAAGLALRLLDQSTMSQIAASSLSLEQESPATGGGVANRTYTGEAMLPVWLLYANRTSTLPIQLAVFDGYLMLDLASLDGFFVNTIPASGSLIEAATIPAFPGLAAVSFVLQPLGLGQASGRLVLGSPSLLTVLDPGP